MLSVLSSETSLPDCIRGHLHHLHPLCHNLGLGCEGARRYESTK